jgi:uncharacterized membrane protein (UPF0127 family)
MFLKLKEPKEFKRWHVIVIGLVILAAGGYSIYLRVLPPPKTMVKIGGVVIPVRLANTPALQFKGWSDVPNMGDVQGMLFLFGSKTQHAMVMRDMQFPLDIVWLDGTEIIDFAQRLAPEPGIPENKLTVYYARKPSTMVLELPAGFTEEHGVKVGDHISIVNSAY